MSRDDATLLDILGAARLAVEFCAGTDLPAFLADKKTQSSVMHQLLVLGEAVTRLSQGFRVRHPVVPWKEMAGMRNMLIHAYDRVDLEEVWNTATADLPALITALSAIAPKSPG